MRRVLAAWLGAGCGTVTIPMEGEYDDGVYHCCAPGQGTACCDGYDAGTCFAYGGNGSCVPIGSDVSSQDPCALCCDGGTPVLSMVQTTTTFTGYPPGCGPGSAATDALVCLACGDGTCGAEENPCTCPDDCS